MTNDWHCPGPNATIHLVIRVLVITNNLQQASFRLRVEALRQALAKRDVWLDVHVRPRGMFSRRTLLKRAAEYDAVLLQRKMLDPLDVRLLRKHAKKLFFDVDDAVMYHSRPVGPVERWRTRRRFLATARAVDRVVAGNEYLADLFRCQGAATTVLPTVVDPGHYQLKIHAATDRPTLVWIGSKSTLPYLSQFVPTLAQAARRVPGLRLITIADVPLPDPPLSTEHVPWSVQTESAALCRGDIGIAPTPEDRWTLGKCGFKIVQYMATGLPVIASPVGANREIVRPNETGFLPENPTEWSETIAALAGDAPKRQALGAAGRRRVEDHFSIETAAAVWGSLLRGDTFPMRNSLPSVAKE
ncbi:MAG: glycosyltransferase family 4 protein [Tepidisphaeraceae bacterium]|jgi:glycosyltransferase involved in cell wall biosynthesis